ncbi:POL5 protein, partial [Todus mexicanus]|nr:POL5 protein [Todus mexicanus]
VLEEIKVPLGVKLMQYVDDFLLSGEEEKKARSALIMLLNFLGKKGLQVSRSKLQFVEQEVKYLGHLTSKGKRRINPKAISSIISMPPSHTKRDIRQFL